MQKRQKAETSKKPRQVAGPRPALMNSIWFFLIMSSILTAAWIGDPQKLTDVSFKAAQNAINLAIGLTGAMALWLGLMKIAESGGLMTILARIIRPVMTRLFPDVPPEHPAMSAMVLNMAANALGLGNAATPMGIKAMIALNRLNPLSGTATDAMCLFLAINTSNVTVLPLGTIAVRAAAGASQPAAILLPSILATSCSTMVAIAAAKFLKKLDPLPHDKAASPLPISDRDDREDERDDAIKPATIPVTHPTKRLVFTGLSICLLGAMTWQVYMGRIDLSGITGWIVPALIFGLVGFGYMKGVPVYEQGVEGAKDGFKVAIRLIPFLVMILVAVGLFRESGAFRILAHVMGPVTSIFGIPAEVIPMALLRPLSGSGAFGLMSEITANAPDSYAAFLAGTIQGSTETTFYVLAVYFGAAGIRKTRYAVTAALAADLAGFIASVFFCSILRP